MLESELKRQQDVLTLYNEREKLKDRRDANDRSLVMVAAGGVAMVGGAACAVAAAPVVAAAGGAALVGGTLIEIFGLAGFVKTA